jgi:hypothetical protein
LVHFVANILKTFSCIPEPMQNGVIARRQVREERYSRTQWDLAPIPAG